jgi:hypothetical protein
LRAFVDHEVEAIVVGAHALAAHGHVRATKEDLADVERLEQGSGDVDLVGEGGLDRRSKRK